MGYSYEAKSQAFPTPVSHKLLPIDANVATILKNQAKQLLRVMYRSPAWEAEEIAWLIATGMVIDKEIETLTGILRCWQNQSGMAQVESAKRAKNHVAYVNHKEIILERKGSWICPFPWVAIALAAVPNHRSDLLATASFLTCLLVGMVGHCS